MVDQSQSIAGHFYNRVSSWIVELGAAAMPAIVEGDHAASGLGQSLDPKRQHPIHRMGRSEAMDQKNRLVEVVSLGRFVNVGNPDTIVRKFLHSLV